MNSVTTAAVLQTRFSAEPIFTLATRDMNRLALQSLLLGAQGLGLENVIVVAGDPFGPTDSGAVAVADFLPTELIAGITRTERRHGLSGTSVAGSHRFLRRGDG